MSGDDDSSRATPPDAAPAPVPRRPRGRRIALWSGAAFAAGIVVVALAVGAVIWSVKHPAGSAWLLGFVPGLTVVEPRGSLVGDFAARRLVYVVPGVGELRIEAPRWHALAASRGNQGRWLHLAIDTLHAERAVWVADKTTAPGAPASLPQSLRLPVEVEVRDATIDELRVGADGAIPARAVRARIHLGAAGGAQHRLDALAASFDRFDAHGAFAIDADAPFAVAATVGAVSSNRDWSATLRASGPLAALATTATARVAATRTHPEQSLDARAVLRPLAPWPLGELHASARDLDLSAFASALPATALTGEATATTSGLDVPATVSIALANSRAGRWNEGLLPVRHLKAELRARPQEPNAIDVHELSAELGTVAIAGGSIAGSGRWTPAAWNIDADLRQVRPAALDARAAQAVVSGKAALVGSGFAPAASASSPPGPARVELQADLAGDVTDRRLPRAAPKTARLRIDARASANEVELRSAQASLGDAAAKLAGRLVRRAASDPWRASGHLELERFDPAPWWPGSADSLLARGTNRINAKGDFDLVVAAAGAGESAYAAAAATTGSATLAIVDSLLAGIAVQGTASYANNDGRARPTLDVVAAGNRIQVEGVLAQRGASNDDWRVVVDAPRLEAIATLLATPAPGNAGRLAPPALAGNLTARARLVGRWPNLTSDGELQGTALRVQAISVRKASGRWRLGSSDNAALDGRLQLDGVDLGGRGLDRVEAQVSGTARAHRLEARVASALLPPQWTDALAARPAASGASANDAGARPTTTSADVAASPGARSVVSVVAEGGLVDVDGSRAAGWRGTLREVAARSLGTPARTWVDARDVRGSVVWAGAPVRVAVEPGRAEVLGAMLRWSRIAWQQGAGGAAARLDAQAEVDAIAVAPILQALQPGFGWGGDLRVGARLKVQSAASVTVDVVVERASGDLTVTDEISTQRLGLSDLRFGVAAEGGVWHFTAAAAGATLGVLSAAATTRTSPSATWPGAETPLEGVGELRVDNLGTWGSWLTPGWRLGGRLHASASFGGRFGAPQYTGHVEGAAISVRNFLEGVNVTDGNVAIALRGTTAHIETFTAKGGAGTLRLEGDAAFDESATAQLRLALDRFELLSRVDRRIVASGTSALRLDARTVALDGTFKVDEGLVDFTRSDAPTLGSDVEVVRRPKAPPPPAAVQQAQAPAPVTATPQRAVRLDLRVDMGERLRVRGRGLDAGLRGELHLASPSGRLAVDGTLRAVDGTYQAYGQKLGIDRGVLAFTGPVENPRLDIEATRPNLDVRVGVTVTGTALSPRIRLFSDPELSDIDKLSWLVLGRASATSGGADTALLQQAALALLSGEGPGVTDRLIKSIGLDEVSVRQSQGAVKDTIVSLGKQISKRWYVGYERGLNTTLGTWQLIYRVAQRVTVRAEAGSDNAVDVIWTWRWK